MRMCISRLCPFKVFVNRLLVCIMNKQIIEVQNNAVYYIQDWHRKNLQNYKSAKESESEESGLMHANPYF